MIEIHTHPFGTFSLSPARNSILRFADSMPNNKIGRWGISLCRKLALGSRQGPFDVVIQNGLNLRLHPRGNRCEKRVICGAHIWDKKEHDALAAALKKHNEDRPFTFLDLGANVGFYSLFLGNTARKISKDVQLVAVEPDKINASRLHANAEASGIEITHILAGIGVEKTTASLIGGGTNRGERRVSASQEDGDGTTIDIIPISELCQDLAIKVIDAMKIDIEGYDYQVLEHFFKTAQHSLWPKLLIIETCHTTEDLLELCLSNGYRLDFLDGLNAVVSRER